MQIGCIETLVVLTLAGAEAAIPGDGTESKGRTVAAKLPAARPRIVRRESPTTSTDSSLDGADDNEKEATLVFVDGKTNAVTPPQERASMVANLVLLMLNSSFSMNCWKQIYRSVNGKLNWKLELPTPLLQSRILFMMCDRMNEKKKQT